ncbi:unnamed protein product [Leptidea sinapis]|uniref:Uncharacterized protein n=1 Tax=Leptidea sinapis TaxID=189913 RepID=A0A5E4PMV6_9NEOP|nr:unnamed protein product [Leptidea sinapis]
MEENICSNLSICIDNIVYSEYVIEWLRYLLNADSKKLKNFLLGLSDSVENSLLSKIDATFSNKVRYIAKSNTTYQRSVLDFLDEALSEQHIFGIVQSPLQETVLAVKDLFAVIDENYDLNNENEANINKISLSFRRWIDGEKIDIKTVLEAVLKDMQINTENWPLNVQIKLGILWKQVNINI